MEKANEESDEMEPVAGTSGESDKKKNNDGRKGGSRSKLSRKRKVGDESSCSSKDGENSKKKK